MTVVPHRDGGIVISYEKLTDEERFAPGISGTAGWPFGVPESILEKESTLMRCEHGRHKGNS